MGQLRYLSPQHRQIARLYSRGKKPAEIAAEIGCSRNLVTSLRRQPLFLEQVAYYEKALDNRLMEARQMLEELMPEAVDALEALLRQADTPIMKRLIANDILKLGGFGASSKVEIKDNQIMNFPLDGSMLKGLLDALRESRQGPPMLSIPAEVVK